MADIKGYRDLAPHELDLINSIKSHGDSLETLIGLLRADETLDQRWVSEGNTDLQKGIMCLVRAVSQPEGF